MAAGLGFKTFTTGEVLTAADTNGYLMQGVLVFADAAARTAAITSPEEGQMSYLKDTNSVESYSGSAWVAVGGGITPINPNLVINGNFTINQRAYVSAANLASGAYGFDRWKSNFTNTTLTFTSAPAGQSVTINSGGGLQQIVEQANVPAGTYTLSFAGTATGRIYNVGATPPAYAASPISFTADGLANVVVEFTATGATKTLSQVKLELGTSASDFVYAGGTIQGEIEACQRYFFRYPEIEYLVTGSMKSTTNADFFLRFPTQMRTAPSLSATSGTNFFFVDSGAINSNISTVGSFFGATVNSTAARATVSGFTSGQAFNINSNAGGFISASAEL
jgi:hypothetical protein